MCSQGKTREQLDDELELLRKRVAELEAAHLLHTSIIESLPDATFVIDLQGRVIAWNRALEEMTGVRKEGMLGRGGYAYAVPFYGEPRPLLIDLLAGDRARFEEEYDFVEKRDHTLYAEIYVPKIYGGKGGHLRGMVSRLFDSNGSAIGAIESIRDVTVRKQAEEGVRISERRFRRLIENIPLGILVIREDQTFEYFNPRFTQIFGYSMEDLPHMENWLEKLYLDSSARERIASRCQGYSGNQPPSGEVFTGVRVRCKGGKEKIINIRSVFMDDGRRILTHGDKTEQYQLEAQLLRVQKMEAIGTLAGGIAHDFNNILTVMLGYTEMTLHKASLDGVAQRNLQQILICITRARDLIKQILTFSRQGEQEQRAVRIDLIVKEALKLLRATLPTTIEIRQKTIASPQSSILGDSTQIHQVLMNLCTNAAHAMDERGGVLEVNLAGVDLNFNTQSPDLGLVPGPYLKLSVSDTGHGIDPDIIERIFDPFFTTKRPGEGTGLGLAVVHGIVKNHGGAITVHSKPRKGTTFDVYLPRVEVCAIEEPEGYAPMAKGAEQILFVDDEQSIADVMWGILKTLGYNVEAKTSSIDALETFRADPDRFDLVITDYTMPHMTGVDLALELMRIRPDIPIILCTGFSQKIMEEEVKALGIRALMTKPFPLKDLARMVRRVLDAK